jgi:hypothetical protein
MPLRDNLKFFGGNCILLTRMANKKQPYGFAINEVYRGASWKIE